MSFINQNTLIIFLGRWMFLQSKDENLLSIGEQLKERGFNDAWYELKSLERASSSPLSPSVFPQRSLLARNRAFARKNTYLAHTLSKRPARMAIHYHGGAGNVPRNPFFFSWIKIVIHQSINCSRSCWEEIAFPRDQKVVRLTRGGW